MKVILKHLVTASLLAAPLFAIEAQAAKYNVCITCANGNTFMVGSPIPNPPTTAYCASNGGNPAKGVSAAYLLKGRYYCPMKALPKLNGVKVP